MKNRVVHFEIPCNEPEKTIKFFETVFNWTFEKFGDNDYWLATTGDTNSPGINGAIMKKKDPNQPITNSISVERIDNTMVEIERSGGQIVLPKTPIPTVGWFSFFKDPDGNIHGLWQDDKEAK